MPDSAVTVSPVYEDILFDIAVGASPEAGGTVAGGGKIKTGESVTVSAVANNGYTFTGWMEDGQVVSTDAKYSQSPRSYNPEHAPLFRNRQLPGALHRRLF